MEILLVGGGSGGPVAPLLAIADKIRQQHPKAKFYLFGTSFGPEKIMSEHANIKFIAIPAGKFRRYFSVRNFASPFLVFAGLLKSIYLLKKIKPDCVVGAGSFVQVPVIWAAWMLKIPCLIHQQDIIPSLANKLCQFCVKNITVTFEDSLKHFYTGSGLYYQNNLDKIQWTGNPFRAELKNLDRKQGIDFFGLKPEFPTLLVLGGGTGSNAINALVVKHLDELLKFVQIIHISGPGKPLTKPRADYKPFEFLVDLGPAYAASDVILSRAGLSTITEICNLSKLSILVPIPNSHQEYNAYVLGSLKASIALTQQQLTETLLVHLIKRLLFDRELQQAMKKNLKQVMPKNADEKIAKLVIKLANK